MLGLFLIFFIENSQFCFKKIKKNIRIPHSLFLLPKVSETNPVFMALTLRFVRTESVNGAMGTIRGHRLIHLCVLIFVSFIDLFTQYLHHSVPFFTHKKPLSLE